MSKLQNNAGNLLLIVQMILTICLFYKPLNCCNIHKAFISRIEGIDNKYDSIMKSKFDTINFINTSPKSIESILVSYPTKDGVLVKKEYNFATGAFKTLQSDSTIVAGYNNQ